MFLVLVDENWRLLCARRRVTLASLNHVRGRGDARGGGGAGIHVTWQPAFISVCIPDSKENGYNGRLRKLHAFMCQEKITLPKIFPTEWRRFSAANFTGRARRACRQQRRVPSEAQYLPWSKDLGLLQREEHPRKIQPSWYYTQSYSLLENNMI